MGILTHATFYYFYSHTQLKMTYYLIRCDKHEIILLSTVPGLQSITRLGRSWWNHPLFTSKGMKIGWWWLNLDSIVMVLGLPAWSQPACLQLRKCMPYNLSNLNFIKPEKLENFSTWYDLGSTAWLYQITKHVKTNYVIMRRQQITFT